ncbi:MAG: UTP--glucose-1-phosphate uridylyltransferase [Microgenomates group bacterium Gr01-1014_16]|nr:MAG: UTP--glucose-1-phosphate uridylyltransferase [Microgenomates group bacterium Gr01-1014_16]
MQNKIKIGVIPAAGSGSRLGYLSSLLPKALFPLYDRPIIHYVVDQMQSIGIEDIYIIVNVFKEKIIEYFKFIQMDLRANIYFVEQKTLNGTGEAMLLTEKYIKKQPFVVMYGDDCTVTQSLERMIQEFFKTNAIVMEGVVKEDDISVLRHTCSVKLSKNGRIIEIIEKPEDPPYMLRGCGVYLFHPDIFNHIRKTPIHPIRKEREITYTINHLAKINRAFGFLINGNNININDYNELLKASQLVKESKKDSKKVIEVLF